MGGDATRRILDVLTVPLVSHLTSSPGASAPPPQNKLGAGPNAPCTSSLSTLGASSLCSIALPLRSRSPSRSSRRLGGPLRGRAVRAVLGRGEACGRGHATRLSPMCQASERGRVRGGEGRRGRERRGETRSAREVGRARGLSPARTSSERVTRPAAGLQERSRASSVASATQRRAQGARRRATRPTCEGPPGPCLDRALVLARRQQASEDILALSFAVQDSYGTRDGGGGNGRRAQNSTARRESGCQSASASHSRRPQRSTTRQGERREQRKDALAPSMMWASSSRPSLPLKPAAKSKEGQP